jgi:hypothetical protein
MISIWPRVALASVEASRAAAGESGPGAARRIASWSIPWLLLSSETESRSQTRTRAA